MCLAMLMKPGAELNMEHIERAWAANPDGGGFAFTGDGEHITMRKFLRLKDMKEGLLKAHTRFGVVSPFLVHFRMATHGTKDLSNVHPFAVRDNLAMIHNGILDVKTWDDRSDTKTFAEDWLTSLPDDWLDNDVISILVEEFLGWSKLVFLTTDPRLKFDWYILNEDRGHWNDEETIWYSNDSYKPKPKVKKAAGKGTGTVVQYPFRDQDEVDWRTADLADDQCYFCHKTLAWFEEPWCLDCEVCNACWQPCDECPCHGTPESARNAYLQKVMKEVNEAEAHYLSELDRGDPLPDGKQEVL